MRAGAGGRPVAPTHAFDAMNNLVAHMLANLTASVRFDGARNTRLPTPRPSPNAHPSAWPYPDPKPHPTLALICDQVCGAL